MPAELAVRAVLRHFGAYLMVAPDSALAPPGKWAHNAALAWDVLRSLFGASRAQGVPLHGALTILGLIALFAARPAWFRWPSGGTPPAGPSRPSA